MKRKRESAVSRTAKGLAALLMALALVFGFASCKTESEEETVYRTVTYSTEHATAPEKLTVADGTALTAEQLPALTESGYTFGGWYDGDTKAEAGSYKVTKDVTLTAQWTVISSGSETNPQTGTVTSYTVTFNTKGGIVVSSQTVESGKTATEPTAPTKDGYTFAGWYNGETKFDFDTAITESITLTATWTPIAYSITYSLDGGTNASANPATYTIESDDITLSDASKDGCTFDGWKNADGEVVTKIAHGSTGDITLTALWTSASGITVTIASASTIGISTTETASTITLTADSGFTGCTWLIDGKSADSVTGAAVSGDGTRLTLETANLTENAVYQVSLSATKDGIPYGAQITVKK